MLLMLMIALIETKTTIAAEIREKKDELTMLEEMHDSVDAELQAVKHTLAMNKQPRRVCLDCPFQQVCDQFKG